LRKPLLTLVNLNEGLVRFSTEVGPDC